MSNYKPVKTPIEMGIKLRKNAGGEPVDPTLYKSLIGSLRYLTFTMLDIMYAVGLVSRHMEELIQEYFKPTKKILRYIQGAKRVEIILYSHKRLRIIGYKELGSINYPLDQI